MTTTITFIVTFITGRFSRLARQHQRGSVTLQEVLWVAFWVVAAAAAVAVIGGVVATYIARIHT